MEKICRICGNLKSIDDFHIKRGTPDDHRNECKECVKTIQKKYKEEPGFKEKGKEYDKKRYQELKDETIQRMRQYRIDNKEEVNEKARERRKDPKVKEIKSIWYSKNKDVMAKHQMNYRKRYPHIVAWRSILYSTLDRMGTLKEGHTVDELGYSAQELKEHIEGQFTKGMSWENHGDWHIDHKRSVIDFPPETSVKVVCSLSNLRPMWATTRDIDGITYEGNLNKNSRSDY
jgi:hypothetical protein